MPVGQQLDRLERETDLFGAEGRDAPPDGLLY
jgi:hypothetical protein